MHVRSAVEVVAEEATISESPQEFQVSIHFSLTNDENKNGILKKNAKKTLRYATTDLSDA